MNWKGQEMLNQELLYQYYLQEYEHSSHRKITTGKKPMPDFEKQVDRLYQNMCKKRGRINMGQLVFFHTKINYFYTLAVKQNHEKVMRKITEQMLAQLIKLDVSMLSKQDLEEIDEDFVAFMKKMQPKKICSRTLFELVFYYKDHKIRQKVSELVPSRPEMEFPEALEMHRKFILHVGPTNSGKTYHALERLKTAKDGIYLGPLRLLALEVYERMHDAGTPCIMLTGQERIADENARVVASTIEMLDHDRVYDIAVIDEAQMIVDSDRGHSWTRAILGVKAKEIHVCMSPDATQVVTHLIELCHDQYEIFRYERKTPLEFENKEFRFPKDVKPGDALIVFSKKSVLDIAGRLEAQGISASVIYGSLPPEIRRKQMKLFLSGKNKVVVSTDAIGMGLNLPVRRIVFIEEDKFDGVTRRKLNTSEVKQIAGRAGRFGMYDVGYVTAMGPALATIREIYYRAEPDITKVSLGFPQVLLSLPEPLDDILKTWHSVETEPPFEKISIEEILYLYQKAERNSAKIDGFEDKRLLYRMVTCPIDIKNPAVTSLWLYYCESYSADVCLKKPSLNRIWFDGIAKYETYYKELDLYYQFSERMGKEIDEQWLAKEREKTELAIMKCLAKGKETYISTCRYCGKMLPVGYAYSQCEQCRWSVD